MTLLTAFCGTEVEVFDPVGDVWALLRQVTELRFEARSRAGTGWDGEGVGFVAVVEPADGVLLFEESGTWRASGRAEMKFANIFRWTRLPAALRLEHLRFGPDNTVFLFDLAPGADGAWREVSRYACGDDCYAATLAVVGGEVTVRWSIRGPRKDEAIAYTYR